MNKSLLILGTAAALIASTSGDVRAGPEKAKHMNHMRADDHGDIMRRLDGLERDSVSREELLQARINQLAGEVEGLRSKELDDVRKLWRTRPDANTWLKGPTSGEFTIGASYKNVDITGGEQPLFGQANVAVVAPAPVGPIGAISNSSLTDQGMGEARMSYAFGDHMSVNAVYSAISSSGTYANSGNNGALVNDVFVSLAHPAPAAAGGVGTSLVGAATGARDLDVNDFRIETENRVVARKKFALNAFAGIRGVDVQDRLQIDTQTNGVVPGAPLGTSIDRHSDFVGIGPHAGVRSRLALTKTLELQGTMSAAAIVGRTNTSHVETATTGPLGANTTTRSEISERKDSVVPVLDLGSKLVWHATDDLAVNVGYDLTTYMGATSDRRAVDPAASGTYADKDHNITMDGFTAGMDWSF